MLTDDATVAAWHNQGLPNDRMSTENAAILTTSGRWPLIIDPQQQGIKWIRNKLGPELRVVQLGQRGWEELSIVCSQSQCTALIYYKKCACENMYIFFIIIIQQVSRCDWTSPCLWWNCADRKSARKDRPGPGASPGQKHDQKRKVGTKTATLHLHNDIYIINPNCRSFLFFGQMCDKTALYWHSVGLQRWATDLVLKI